jgi:copper chaperone CopZ
MLQKYVFETENPACNGYCTHDIKAKLLEIAGVRVIDIDVATGNITIMGLVEKELLINKLQKLGYNQKDSYNFSTKKPSYFNLLAKKAKEYFL